jgi:hydrogenase maturation protease
MNPLVIGVGNRRRGDDAVGPLVADELATRGVRTVVVEGDLSDLLTRWSPDDDVVIVDAVDDGDVVGTVRVLERRKVPIVDSGEMSTHGFGLAAAIEFARRLDRMPHSIAIVGVSGRDFTLGEPSSQLRGHVGEIADRVARTLTAVGDRSGDLRP